jgi:geranylgeranyl pyrophosphate synthase
VLKYGGVEYALGRAHDYGCLAKEDLSGFPPGDDRDTLSLIADYVVDRDR